MAHPKAIFAWSIKSNTHDAVDSHPPPARAEVSQRDKPAPKQQMRALLAHMHYKLLFGSSLLIAQE